MKFALICLAAISIFSLSALADDNLGSVLIEGFYGMSNVNPSDLNTYRSQFQWNNTTATQGTFNNLTYFGGSIGVHVADPPFLSIRYEQESQTLPNTAIGGTSYSIQDSFVYNPIYLNLDFPIQLSGGWMFTLGGGVGYALKYDLYQQNTGGNGENVDWKANPIGYRGRASLAYMLGSSFGIFAEVIYESISASSLSAAQSYNTTINGTPIAAGQTLKSVTTGNTVKVDMSGVRYGVGLRLMF